GRGRAGGPHGSPPSSPGTHAGVCVSPPCRPFFLTRASLYYARLSKCNKFTSQVKKPLDGVPRRSGALVFADPHLVHIFTVVHSSQIARRAAASEVRLVKTTVCQSTAPHPNKNP